MVGKKKDAKKSVYTFDKPDLERLYDRAAVREVFAREGPAADPGWSPMPWDPMELLEAFPKLAIRNGLALRGYRHVGEDGARGVIWAVSAGAKPQMPEDCDWVDVQGRRVPRPDGALEDFMEAVRGDGSPESIISASFFAREARELGARRYGASWSFEEVLFKDPTRATKGQVESWDFELKRPRSWKPCLALEQGGAQVVFHTHRRLDREAVLRTVDTFPQNDVLVFESNWVELAYGKTSYYP